MASVPRLWAGETVACLATGPSLNRDDCEYVRGKCRVIAVNDAHRLAPWADVLYSSDRLWWPHYKGVPTFAGMKYGVGSGQRKSNQIRQCPDVRVLRNDGYSGISTDPTALRTGRNSGYSAVNLAVLFGASRILLLGYNMGYPGGKAHFFGNHPTGLPQHEYLYPSFRKSFDTMVQPLKELGVEVINCTEHTSLTTFPCARLRDVLLPVAA